MVDKKNLKAFSLILALSTVIWLNIFLVAKAEPINNSEPTKKVEPISKEEMTKIIQQIFFTRNKGILEKDKEAIDSIYDKNTKYGVWACEYEEKKMKYIHNWAEKQGAKFIDISPKIVIRWIKGDSSKVSVRLMCNTEYTYVYEDLPEEPTVSRMGTNHDITLVNKDGVWQITKEWYKDPFADSLDLNNIKVDAIKQFISTQLYRDFSTISKRRIDAVNYANKFCGSASEEQYGYKYNPKYKNYNPLGGDCANFASQILFEGGKFKKTGSWTCDKGGASAKWVNAGAFKDFMIGSKRASIIAYGSYEKVYKASFKLLPGDFVAYEKNNDVNHISVVTGADSKGYPLVTCHNIDRNEVPWDLGWSNRNIRFYLVRVHY